MGDEEEEVILFGLGWSPYSCRVEIALKLKGIKYEFIQEDLSNKSPLLLKYNSVHKKIPLLVHNGNPIAESLIIVEYIDDTWKGTSILPQDPYERAIARFWSKFIDDKCMPVLLKLFKQQEGEDEAKEMFKILEKEVEGKKFFGGDNVGLVDIAAISVTYWITLVQQVLGLDILSKENFPKLSEWTDEIVNIGVLVHNGNPIAESLVILEYIEETWKGVPILPEDPHDRAMARFWSRFIDEKCEPALSKSAENGMEESLELLKMLGNELKGNKFFGGENIGIVDIAAVGISYWLGVFEEITGSAALTNEMFPKLREWVDEFLSCSVVKQTLPPRDHLLDRYRARILATIAIAPK